MHRVYTYNVVEEGGHALLTCRHLGALATIAPDVGVEVGLITARGLTREYRGGGYPILDILPSLIPRDKLHNRLRFFATRLQEHLRRRALFLDWCRGARRFDVLHVEQTYPEWLAWRDFAILRALGYQLIYTVHNVKPHRYPTGVPRAIFDAWNRAAWRQCNALIVFEESIRDDLRRFVGDGCPPIHVVPLGLYTRNIFSYVAPPSDRSQLLFFGKIRRNKGLLVLLDAVRTLPEVHLTIVGAFDAGDPSYQRRVRAQIGEIAQGRVTLHAGHVDDASRDGFFENAAIVILPYTEFSSQSGVLFDAIAHSRPVVATDVGALGATVRSLGVGEIASPGDSRDLARAIMALTEEQRYVSAVARVRRVQSERSVAAMANATLDVYRSVIASLS